jgi:hypothetical protein
MDEVKKYWRDAAIKLLGWGTGSLIVVSGWALTISDRFEIGPFADGTAGGGSGTRAIALLFFAIGFGVSWYFAVRWIFVKHLSKDVDASVLPWSLVRLFLLVIISLLWIVSGVVALL